MSVDPSIKLTKKQAESLIGMGYSPEQLKAAGFFGDFVGGIKKGVKGVVNVGKTVLSGVKQVAKTPLGQAVLGAVKGKDPRLDAGLALLGMGADERKRVMSTVFRIRPMVKRPIGVAPSVPTSVPASGRKRGRPKKMTMSEPSPVQSAPLKRGRGRPRSTTVGYNGLQATL